MDVQCHTITILTPVSGTAFITHFHFILFHLKDSNNRHRPIIVADTVQKVKNNKINKVRSRMKEQGPYGP